MTKYQVLAAFGLKIRLIQPAFEIATGGGLFGNSLEHFDNDGCPLRIDNNLVLTQAVIEVTNRGNARPPAISGFIAKSPN